MTFQYLTLFTVEVTHSFYAERCPDLRFLVPAETRRRLDGGRLLAKERDGALHVLFEADAAGAPRVSLAGATLRFGLRLLNPYFGNFTQLAAGFPARKLHLTNASDPTLLAAEEGAVLVGPLFTHAPSAGDRPVSVTLRDAAGEVVGARTLQVGEGSASFDLRGRPAGSLSLEEVLPDGTTTTVPYFLDVELQKLDAAGVVEVEIDDAFYTTPPALEIAFEAREEVLSYYLVVRNYGSSDLDRLEVSDEGFGEDGRPEVAFEKVLPAAFTAAQLAPSLIAGADEEVVLFRSQTPLARRDRGRRRIQLSSRNDVLIPNLPQPGSDKAKAELIIHVSKP